MPNCMQNNAYDIEEGKLEFEDIINEENKE
jgi:hypothetical protein